MSLERPVVGIKKPDAAVRRPPPPPADGAAPAAAQAEAPTLSSLAAKLQQAFKNNILSEAELSGLAKDVARAAPDVKDAFLKTLADDLAARQSAGQPVTLQQSTLDAVGKAFGVGLKQLFDLRQGKDATIGRDVNQGLEKTATAVDGKTASDTRNQMQEALQVSHGAKALSKGDLTPGFKAAKVVGEHVYGKVGQKLDEKLPADVKAAKDAVAPHLETLATQTAAQLAQNPDAMKNLAGLASKLGTADFGKALAGSGKDIGKAFCDATGCAASNPEAIAAMLQGANGAMGKLVELAPKLGNPKLVDLVTKTAPKVTETTAKLGARFAPQAAAAAGTAAGAGATAAKVGVSGAATAGKALPVIGNVIAVGSTLMAGASFVGQLFQRPTDMKKVLNEGLHFLTQGVGIAFPWVALGGSIAKLGTDALIGKSDEAKAARGEEVTKNASLADLKSALPHLLHGADLMEAVLDGAGHGTGNAGASTAADAVRRLKATAKSLEGVEAPSAEQLGKLNADQQAALTSVFEAASGRLGELVTEQKKEPTLHTAGAYLLGEAFRFGAQAMRKSEILDRNLKRPGTDMKPQDVAAKRDQYAGDLVSSLGTASVAKATETAAA